MSVQRIREAILTEARQEADKIVADAQARLDEQIQTAARKLDEEFKRRFGRGRQDAEQESRHQIMRVRARHNQALLRRRNEILDDLFRQAAERIAGQPDEQYRELAGAWLQQLPQDTAGELLCAARDADRLAPLVEELNRSRGPDAQLTLTPGDRPELGGVVFRAERFEIDLSVDTRIAHLREELAPEVAAALFPPDVAV